MRGKQKYKIREIDGRQNFDLGFKQKRERKKCHLQWHLLFKLNNVKIV